MCSFIHIATSIRNFNTGILLLIGEQPQEMCAVYIGGTALGSSYTFQYNVDYDPAKLSRFKSSRMWCCVVRQVVSNAS